MGPSLSGRVWMASAPFVRSGITDCSPRFIARTALTVLSLKNGRVVARRTHSVRNLMRYFTQRWLPFYSHFAVSPVLVTKFVFLRKDRNIRISRSLKISAVRSDDSIIVITLWERDILKGLFSLSLSLCTFHQHEITEREKEEKK